MKSYLFLAVQLLAILAYSQKYHVNENFNNTQNINSLPLWTTPTQANWMISNDVWGNPGNQSLNGSKMAYIKVNYNSSNTGYLYSPIFDNTADSITHLSFDYNFVSDTFQFDTFFVEIYNNQQWNKIFSRTTDDCGSFFDSTCIGNFPTASIDLPAYQSDSSQLRFGYSYLAGKSVIAAIDNVVVSSQKNNDLNLFPYQTEFSGCEMLDSISFFISNEGFNIVSSANISYSINGANSILIGNVSNFFNDTTTLSFLPNNLFYGRNEIKVFSNWQADENRANDTITIIIQNYKIDNYHTEGFESFVDGPCVLNRMQVLKNGWEVEGNKLMWSLENTNCAKRNQGNPNSTVNTYTENKNFFYLTWGNSNSTDSLAILNSPCINFNNFTSPQLSFWYHKFDTIASKIEVEVFDTAWTRVYSIQGQAHINQTDPWKIAKVDLSAYAGKNVQLRIVGIHDWNHNTTGRLAIDEISIYDQLNQDIGLLKIPSPSTDSCSLPSNAIVQVLLANFGSQNISANNLLLELYHNGSLIQTETVSSSININDSLLYTFNSTLNLSSSGEHQIEIKAILSGDTLIHNNRFHTTIYNQSVQLPYFYENFENAEVGHFNFMNDDLNGWTRQPDSSNTHTWHIWQGEGNLVYGIPFPSPPIFPTGPSGDHTFSNQLMNGNGNYIKLNTAFRTPQPAAHLISPCGGIDLTSSQNGKVMLSFWYHMFGRNTNDLFVDVHNGSQWINGVSVIRGQQQLESKQPWRSWQVSLDNFTHISNAKIRFRASGISSVGGGDISLDDIRILDRDTTDAALLGVSRPETDCGLSNQEQLRVRIQNTGTDDIYRLDLAYQITHTDLNGQSQTYPIVRELDVVTIIPLANYTYNFTNHLNLSSVGTYQIKVWSELSGDGYAFNDTLVHIVKNTLKPTDYCEDFNELGLNEQPHLSFGNYNLLSNDWAVSEVNDTYFVPTNSKNAQGIISRSKSPDDIFLIKTPFYNQLNYVQTPCIEIADSAKQLTFWYNIGSPSPYWIIVKGNKNQAGFYEVIDSIFINSNHLYAWHKATVNIADFRNSISQFEISFYDASGQIFTTASYFALDDFCLSDAGNQEIQLSGFPQIYTTECDYSNQESMQFSIRNVGKNPIDSFMIITTVDTNRRKAINHYYTDTTWYFPSPPLNFDDTATYIVNNTVDMSYKTKYHFSANVIIPGEKVTRDNKIENSLYSYPTIDTNYTVDFEMNNQLNGIKLSNNKGFNWKIRIYLPVYDHTPGMNGGGYYLFANDNDNLTPNDTAVFYTPCFDLSNMATPTFSFWYHKRAQSQLASSKLLIDIRQNGTGAWQRFDSIVGNTHQNNSSPYLNKAISLSAFNNQIVQLRVSANYNNGHNIAIDDIQVVDSLITSSAEQVIESSSFQLYPNPSKGQFTLEVDQSFIGETFQIRGLSGKVVQEGKVNKEAFQIQMNVEAKGIYFLSIPNQNVQEKLVVY